MVKKVMISVSFFLIMIFTLINMVVQAEELNYSHLFPHNHVIDVKIEMDEKQIEELYNNPLDKIYYPASIDYNGYQLDVVGIRTKGTTNLNILSNMDSNKYSFKLKFDKFIKGQNLLSLTTIHLNNNFGDPSYLREYLSYKLMEDMGVPVPEFSFINLYINEELKGFYLAVQQIDEAFIKSNFEIDNGDLYEAEGEGSDLMWRGDNFNYYSGMGYKSNKNTDHQALLAMLNELNNGNDYKKYLNIEEILGYFAVNTVLSNMDSYYAFFPKNYYLYEENGVFSILPWDLNMSFGGLFMGKELEQLVTLKIDEPTMGPLQDRPLIANLLNVPEFKEIYYQYIDEIITYLNPEKFKNELTDLAELIRPHVENDSDKFYSLEEFDESFIITLDIDYEEKHIEELKEMKASIALLNFLDKRIDNISEQLSGEIPSVGDGNGMGIRGAEDMENMIMNYFTHISPVIKEELAGVLYFDDSYVNFDDQSVTDNEILQENDIHIIIKYLDLISTSMILLLMMILSVLFLKRKI